MWTQRYTVVATNAETDGEPAALPSPCKTRYLLICLAVGLAVSHCMWNRAVGQLEQSVRLVESQMFARNPYKLAQLVPPRAPLGLAVVDNQSSWMFHGQDLEDKLIFEYFFRDTLHGTFMEMGALDGHRYSNTLFFEHYRGWNGLLVEPQPNLFSKVVQHRRASFAINGVACVDNDTPSIPIMGVDNVMDGPYSRSFNAMLDGELSTKTSGSFRQRFGSSYSMAPCFNLTSMLLSINMTHIDFFSLDVEGAELVVLQSLNLEAIQIDVLLMEVNSRTPAANQLLFAQGYEQVKLPFFAEKSRNNLYVHRRARDMVAGTQRACPILCSGVPRQQHQAHWCDHQVTQAQMREKHGAHCARLHNLP